MGSTGPAVAWTVAVFVARVGLPSRAAASVRSSPADGIVNDVRTLAAAAPGAGRAERAADDGAAARPSVPTARHIMIVTGRIARRRVAWRLRTAALVELFIVRSFRKGLRGDLPRGSDDVASCAHGRGAGRRSPGGVG